MLPPLVSLTAGVIAGVPHLLGFSTLGGPTHLYFKMEEGEKRHTDSITTPSLYLFFVFIRYRQKFTCEIWRDRKTPVALLCEAYTLQVGTNGLHLDSWAL